MRVWLIGLHTICQALRVERMPTLLGERWRPGSELEARGQPPSLDSKQLQGYVLPRGAVWWQPWASTVAICTSLAMLATATGGRCSNFSALFHR
jgi:hypothetical protein